MIDTLGPAAPYLIISAWSLLIALKVIDKGRAS